MFISLILQICDPLQRNEECPPNFDILKYAHQVTEFLMGFQMIPKLWLGVIPFRNYKTIKTTY